jgi:3-deoxy-D-manno-octulosonate 8-phosphate phosphatase (KDO 8-P phosphatase)
MQQAVKNGFPVAIITGGASESVRTRFNGLGITDVYLKTMYKLDAFHDFLAKYSLDPAHVMYMGDDLPDYEVMSKVGFPVSPADAAEEIIRISKYVSPRSGGDGCVRDVVEQVLRAQGLWFKTSDH